MFIAAIKPKLSYLYFNTFLKICKELRDDLFIISFKYCESDTKICQNRLFHNKNGIRNSLDFYLPICYNNDIIQVKVVTSWKRS